jgi:hypothetical protein
MYANLRKVRKLRNRPAETKIEIISCPLVDFDLKILIRTLFIQFGQCDQLGQTRADRGRGDARATVDFSQNKKATLVISSKLIFQIII